MSNKIRQRGGNNSVLDHKLALASKGLGWQSSEPEGPFGAQTGGRATREGEPCVKNGWCPAESTGSGKKAVGQKAICSDPEIALGARQARGEIPEA